MEDYITDLKSFFFFDMGVCTVNFLQVKPHKVLYVIYSFICISKYLFSNLTHSLFSTMLFNLCIPINMYRWVLSFERIDFLISFQFIKMVYLSIYLCLLWFLPSVFYSFWQILYMFYVYVKYFIFPELLWDVFLFQYLIIHH